MFYVVEEVWDDQQRPGGSPLLELLKSFDRFSSRKVAKPMQSDINLIEVTATFDEFDEIGVYDPIPEYRFIFTRHEDGSVTRNKAEKVICQPA